MTVLAAVLEAPGRMTLKEFPRPVTGPEDGLLKVEMVGICATDVKLYHGKIDNYALPLVLGHELVGRIETIGDKIAAKTGMEPGQRVVVEASVVCGQCEACLTGNYKFCSRTMGYGLKTTCEMPPHLWGGYSQYMYLAPGSVFHSISEDVPKEAAVLTTAVIANGIQWIRLHGNATVGECVVIQGFGSQAMAATIAAKESGADPIIVIGTEQDVARFELARAFGATHCLVVGHDDVRRTVADLTHGRGADLVLDATGSPLAVDVSLDVVRKQGTVIQAGLLGSDVAVPTYFDKIAFKEIRLQGVMSKGYKAVSAAVKLIESRKYPFERLLSQVYSLRDAELALKAAGGEVSGLRPLKVAIDPWM